MNINSNKICILTFIYLIKCVFQWSNIFASSNLATINTIQNGFATVKECNSDNESGSPNCDSDFFKELGSVLDLSTTNRCIASKAEIQAAGNRVPQCPKSLEDIKGLDNTYPNGGTFALYTGNNDSFIHNLALNFLKDGTGVFNLVLPKEQIVKLKRNSELLKVLNNKMVNIVEVETMPSVNRWMQDSFQFTTIHGKPAIYQLEHFREDRSDFTTRFACLLAKKCRIPYYIPPDMTDPYKSDSSSLNSGGNLEILPGGTFYRGIIKTPGFNRHEDPRATYPWQSKYQKIQKDVLEKAGNKVLDLDTSFLTVGHVDEIINIVKTNSPAPCNFAVMLASPEKAFELMEQSVSIGHSTSYLGIQKLFEILFIPNVYAGLRLGPVNIDPNGESGKKTCKNNGYSRLVTDGSNAIITDERVNEIYSMNCIDTEPVEEFIKSNEYQILKNENLNRKSPKAISEIINDNEKLIVQELQETSGCSNPQIIPIPVFFRHGLSYTPDLVNGVVQTSANSPSKVILPRSYFAPFDKYVQSELNKLGVKTTFAHDMGYHLLQGEVHCGSNTARICEP